MSNKHLKARILHLIELWKPVLDLQNWSISIDWTEKKLLAGARALPQYKQLGLYFNLKRIATEVSDLEELVVHELVHAPLWTLARAHEDKVPTKITSYFEEHATSTVTAALLKARALGEQRSKRR